MATIYENIRRLQQLAVGGDIQHYATEIRERIQTRAQQALDIVGTEGHFADILQEIKEVAAAEEKRVIKLNNLLSITIEEEAKRLLGSAG